jgi:cell division protein FtsW (lipid II flippase)
MKQWQLVKFIVKDTWWGRYVFFYLLINCVLPNKPSTYKNRTDWMQYGVFYRNIAVSVFVLLAVLFVWKWYASRKVHKQQNAIPDVLALVMTMSFVVYSLVLYFMRYS